MSRFAAGAVFGEVRVDSRLWSSVSRYRVVVVMFFCQACRCGRLGASATLSFHPVLIVFLCFEIRIPLSSRCGHVFCQACRCGRLGASATLSFHPVLIVFLCFEIRIPLSSRCGHVFLPSLSLWTAWRVCNSELTIPFSHVGVASHKSHHMTSQCIM